MAGLYGTNVQMWQNTECKMILELAAQQLLIVIAFFDFGPQIAEIGGGRVGGSILGGPVLGACCPKLFCHPLVLLRILLEGKVIPANSGWRKLTMRHQFPHSCSRL